MAEGSAIAYHGWGFDASCWEVWENYLLPEFEVQLFEAGYFSTEPNDPVFPEEAFPKVILSHSFGLHQCPPENLKQADMLIVFSGFQQFHPVAAQFKRRSKMVLREMIRQVQTDPGEVLQKFYKNVFYPQKPWQVPDKTINNQKIADDLVRLDREKMDLKILKSVDKISILHGSDDSIVPRRKGRELFDEFAPHCKYFEIRNAGHALPFTHSEQCQSFIEPEIQAVKSLQ